MGNPDQKKVHLASSLITISTQHIFNMGNPPNINFLSAAIEYGTFLANDFLPKGHVNLVMAVYFRGLLSLPSGMRGVHKQMEKAGSWFYCSRRPIPHSGWGVFKCWNVFCRRILGVNYPTSCWPVKLNLQQRNKSNSRLLFYWAPLRVKLCNHIMEVAFFFFFVTASGYQSSPPPLWTQNQKDQLEWNDMHTSNISYSHHILCKINT